MKDKEMDNEIMSHVLCYGTNDPHTYLSFH